MKMIILAFVLFLLTGCNTNDSPEAASQYVGSYFQHIATKAGYELCECDKTNPQLDKDFLPFYCDSLIKDKYYYYKIYKEYMSEFTLLTNFPDGHPLYDESYYDSLKTSFKKLNINATTIDSATFFTETAWIIWLQCND